MDAGTLVKIEPCMKRVRVYLGGKIVVDSIRSKLVWEVPHYPAYYFPMADVSMNCLIESDRTERSSTRGEARYFNVRSGSRLVENAAVALPTITHFERFWARRFRTGSDRFLVQKRRFSSTGTIHISASTFCAAPATSKFCSTT